MSWVEVFAVLIVSHLVGDFLLQTEWQATHKFGGLAPGRPAARRALVTHVLAYTLCFVPAFVWVAEAIGWSVVCVAALVCVPHLIQDDGRLLLGYLRRVKHSDSGPGDLVFVMADQSLHVVALFGIALVAAVA